jgi:hypothetical protein
MDMKDNEKKFNRAREMIEKGKPVADALSHYDLKPSTYAYYMQKSRKKPRASTELIIHDIPQQKRSVHAIMIMGSTDALAEFARSMNQ